MYSSFLLARLSPAVAVWPSRSPHREGCAPLMLAVGLPSAAVTASSTRRCCRGRARPVVHTRCTRARPAGRSRTSTRTRTVPATRVHARLARRHRRRPDLALGPRAGTRTSPSPTRTGGATPASAPPTSARPSAPTPRATTATRPACAPHRPLGEAFCLAQGRQFWDASLIDARTLSSAANATSGPAPRTSPA